MVISANQRSLANELLGMFEGKTFDWFEYSDREDTTIVSSTPLTNQIDFTKASARLTEIFDAIELAGDDRQTLIADILTEYNDIRLIAPGRITVGGTNTAPGMRYSVRGQIAHLKKLLWTNLGFRIRVHGEGGSRNLRVSR